MRHLILGVLFFGAACGVSSEDRASANDVAPPVRTGPPNTDFSPAFPQQTRAPEAGSNVAFNIEAIARLENPWAIAFLPHGRALVTERRGRLRIVTRSGDVSAPIEGLPPIRAQGQGGLMDVTPGPTFAQDRLIYWSYSEPRESGDGTAVARGRLSEDDAHIGDVEVIFRQDSANSRGHYGSRLDFDRSGRLFISLGERQAPPETHIAQDLSTTLGKVVRINPDGSIPNDNPFVGRNGVPPAIWSYGHRNIQGADIHPTTDELWEVEHGPRGGDELNVVRAGRNYGWSVITYGEHYSGQPITDHAAQEGMEQPVYYWDPVIAPGDMDFYRGDLFPWRGDVLIAGLNTFSLVRLRLDGERVVGEERFNLGHGRIRDISEAPDGALWVATDESNGQILVLTPKR